MKKAALFTSIILLCLTGCKPSVENENQQQQGKLPSSYGAINSLSIILNDSLWMGQVGETLREELTTPVRGLKNEEPIFTLSHVPPKAFCDRMRQSRLFIKVDFNVPPHFNIVKDTFAQPQTGIFIGGENAEAIVKLIKENAHTIIGTLKQAEIKENQQRLSRSLHNSDTLQAEFGIHMKIPTAYHYAEKTDHFVRIQKDIPHGSMGVLIYQVPLKAVEQNNVVASIIQIRDSIGKHYICHPDEGTYMMTGKAFSPYLFETTVDGKFTYLTKGTWVIKGGYMTGPFINYAVRDEKNKRYLILEGFLYKPQAPNKRNNMFELKAIIHSVKF